MRPRWIFALFGAVTLFYWRILFTKQFSVLWMWEPVTQSYAWYHFAASQLKQGILPLWDPYRFSGSTFIGEMQTGLFYPLKFLGYFMPFGDNGLFSERVYHQIYVLSHALAALFMFLLARYFRLSHFASFVAGLSFALGGFIANTGHPHTLDSAIWLPLIVLFFLKALDETVTARAAFFTALSGIALGMAVLGGAIHMVLMDGIVIATMSATLWLSGRRPARVLAIAAGVAVAGFLFGAIQLLPSVEYSTLSYRWVGGETPIRSLQKVPYQYLGELARFSPRSLVAFLFGAADAVDVPPSNYAGVLPLFLSIIGVWTYRQEKWVRYFAILGALAYFYAWGSFSFLHGVLYLLPGLDIAREAGRFIQLTHFAMAILAGYGIQHLFSGDSSAYAGPAVFMRGVRWLVVFLAALLIAASLQTTIAVRDQTYLSFFFIAGAYAVLETARRGFLSRWTKGALTFLLLWDLYSFNWIVRNKAIAQAEKQDHMAELTDSRKLADQVKSNGGVFRIHFDGAFPPNIGDAYGVQMTGGMGATMLSDYALHLGHPQMVKLLNVRYTLRKTGDDWRVHENPEHGERAWVVHQFEVDASKERPLKRLDDPTFDPKTMVILDRTPSESIDGEKPSAASSVQVTQFDSNALEFRVEANGRGLLVVSEVFYPGWLAFVNDRPAPIYRANGFLRSVPVPNGTSVVRLEYRPGSVTAGAALTFSTLLGTVILGFWGRAAKRRHDQALVLAQMRRDWDERARENARFYVATGKEEWSDEEFFESGRAAVAEIVTQDLDAICNDRDRAAMRILEIGCGAGRMTKPLSEVFGIVHGVDISPEMIAQARTALHGRTNVELHVNNGADLSMFPPEHFDFAMSAIVFQHIPKRAVIENYICEVWRVLKRGSMFKFQLQGCPIPDKDTDTWVGAGFSEEQTRRIAARFGFQIKESHGAGTQYYWLTFFKP